MKARKMGLSRDSRYSPRVLSEREKGYLEGIIDGEGCVSLREGKVRGKAGHSSFRFQLSVVNSDNRIIYKVKEIIGCGTIGSRDRGKYRRKWKFTTGKKVISWLFPQLNLVGKEGHRLLLLEALTVHHNGKDPIKLRDIADRVHRLNQGEHLKGG